MDRQISAKIYQKIKSFPNKPGVYFFKDSSGKILYVGKALSLKKRVKSYFYPKSDNKIRKLLDLTVAVDYSATKNELEALLLEARLIKLYQPVFNLSLKDGRRFLYLGITKEKYPRLFFLRKPEITTSLANWFGPFASAQSLREVIRFLRRIFPYRSCQNLPKKTCLYYHLKLCPGVCEQKLSAEEYQKQIKKINLFLDGRIVRLYQDLLKQMKTKAAELDFESAEKIKTQIQLIDRLLGSFKKMPQTEDYQKQLNWLRKTIVRFQGIETTVLQRIEAYDVSNLGNDICVGSMVVFIQGEPQKDLYRQFKIKTRFGGDPAGLKEIIRRRLKHPEWIYPQLILVDGGKPQAIGAFSALKEFAFEEQIALLALVKGKEELIIPRYRQGKIISWKTLPVSRRNLGLPMLQFARDEAHRFAQRYYRLRHKKLIFASELK